MAEVILARVAAARQSVQETAALAAHVRQAYQQAPAPEASALLREAIEKELSPTIRIKAEPLAADLLRLGKPGWLRRHWAAVAAMAVCLLVLVGLFVPADLRARRPADPVAQSVPEASARVLGMVDTNWRSTEKAAAPEGGRIIVTRNPSSHNGIRKANAGAQRQRASGRPGFPDEPPLGVSRRGMVGANDRARKGICL